MKIQVLADADAVAKAGAAVLAEAARAAVADAGRMHAGAERRPDAVGDAACARSDERRALAAGSRSCRSTSAWRRRTAPIAISSICARACSSAPLPPDNLYPMPVEERDLAAAAARYARTLESLAGAPPTLDLVHLGLGPDGHTASLVPGDPVLEVTDAWVGVTGAYQQHRRMTLTYPVLNRARAILFVVTGDEKADALLRLSRHDPTIPAGRIENPSVTVLADEAAAARLDPAARG